MVVSFYQWIASIRKIKKLSGLDYLNVLMLFWERSSADPALKKAMEDYRSRSRKRLLPWIISVLAFALITLALGMLTAGHD